MKQWYTSQLYDRSNASIAKALLLQMPNVSFTQYRNELARVLGTRQRPSKSVSSKVCVSNTSEGTESEEKEKAVSKSKCTSVTRRSVLNLLRSRIFELSWMGRLPKIRSDLGMC